MPVNGDRKGLAPGETNPRQLWSSAAGPADRQQMFVLLLLSSQQEVICCDSGLACATPVRRHDKIASGFAVDPYNVM